MRDSTPTEKKTAPKPSRRSTGKKHGDSELPPPASGKELAEYLDKMAARLSAEDLENLDRAIKASRESSR